MEYQQQHSEYVQFGHSDAELLALHSSIVQYIHQLYSCTLDISLEPVNLEPYKIFTVFPTI